MIIEACKPQFGLIINLLLRFILHLSALQLMRWLQSYDGLKFCATDRKFGGRIQGQNSMGFGGRIRDHVTFIYYFPDAYLKLFSITHPPIINQPSVDACRSVTR